ncbi:MAG: cytochrome c oxidase subunit II [Pyrinomonadaceae bacterium]
MLLQSVPQMPFTPEQASTFAGEVDALYLYLTALTLFFSVLISGLIIYFAVRYRRRSPLEIPRPIHGSLQLEAIWTVIPFIISMSIFAWGASLYFKMYRPPQEAIDVYVVGKQWMWKFQHAGGQREINELHVPLGARVRLTMTTEDVIHSLYVPAFRIKSDVVPGRYTYAWFEATKPGRYYLFCAEYCGTNHSGMGGWVVVQEPAAYQAWLSGGATDSPASQGQKLFQDLGCATCHQQGTQGRGPVLTNVFGQPVQLANGEQVTADGSYIRESIVNPAAKTVAGFQQIMPTYQGQVSEEQILQLIAYIRSLSQTQQQQGQTDGGGPGGAAAGTTSGIEPTAQRSNPIGPTTPAAPGQTGPTQNTAPGQATRGQGAVPPPTQQRREQ